MTVTVDVGQRPIREVHEDLKAAYASGEPVRVVNTLSRHNLGVGMPPGVDITFEGSVGYYCGGLNTGANVTIERNATRHTLVAGPLPLPGAISTKGVDSATSSCDINIALVIDHRRSIVGSRCSDRGFPDECTVPVYRNQLIGNREVDRITGNGSKLGQ